MVRTWRCLAGDRPPPASDKIPRATDRGAGKPRSPPRLADPPRATAHVDQKRDQLNAVRKSTLSSANDSREDFNSDSLAQIMELRAESRYPGGHFILVSNSPDDGAEVKPVPAGRPDCGESAPRKVVKPAFAQCGLNSEMLPNRGEFLCWMVPRVDGKGCVEQCTVFVDCLPP